MNHILSWNCRGLGSIPAVGALRRIVINEQPQLIFLQETKLKQVEMEKIKNKLRMDGMLVVDCGGEGRGRRGGLALLWKNEWQVSVTTFSMNHIDVVISCNGGDEWRFTGLYGFPEEENKHKTGVLLKALRNANNLPWLCGGDMNLMLWSQEKQGGDGFNYENAEMFREALDYGELEDLHYNGYPFTWTNNQGGEKNIQERLDRFCATAKWREMFNGSLVTHLEKRKSDHLPLIVSIRKSIINAQKRRPRKLFRFEEMWLKEESCEDTIKKAWQPEEDVCRNITRTARELRGWSKETFGGVAKELRECKMSMGKLMEEEPTAENLNQMRALDERMDELEAREEIYWRQRSRQDWLKYGDKNSKFFHAKAKQRASRNNIARIKDESGLVYEEEGEIAELFVQHFETLFTANESVESAPVLDKVTAKLSRPMQNMLTEPYVAAEIHQALKQMHPTKAPGPDGMCALFYQKFWSIVGHDVEKKLLDILNNGGDIESLNHTYIALIPKKKICESPVDYRPISLCNVLFKIVSKVLANRLKRILPDVIDESQSGFVPGRLITDNVLVAYECFHYLRKKKVGKEGYLGLKLDMSKAYDRVEWSFLEGMMEKLGFPERFVQLIMAGVKSASFSILINGQPTRTFYPSRGLRQGDPLSPFLFIICAEGLSTLLRDAEAKKEIHGLKIGKKVDAISHLFFADDSLLFSRANEVEVDKILEILSIYEVASGQKLNMDKSEVSFSRNIELEKKQMLQMKLTFNAVEDHGKYLGLPTHIGSSKKRVFQIIQERVLKKLKGWKERYLSQAGREILIKTVAQAIPTYAMQCFTIPKGILNEIERMCRCFFWGQKKEEKKLAWIAWHKLYDAKVDGGLGMRNLVAFNNALLAKQAWRLVRYPNSLVAKILKMKYFPKCEFMEAKISPMASYTWRSILSARSLLAKGLRRVVGNGHSVNIWHDPWMPSLPNFRVLQREPQAEGGPVNVRELISQGEWNKVELMKWFSAWEIAGILSIPLPRHPCEDRWVWHHSKKGEFTVRSAYFVALNLAKCDGASTSVGRPRSVWKRLWRSQLPTKIKSFGWRVLHGGIPVRSLLRCRNVVDDVICPMCGNDKEDVMHALVLCVEARMVWHFSPLRIDVTNEPPFSVMEWVTSLEKVVREEVWWDIFWSILWGLWLRRNAWVFDQRKVTIEEVIARATKIVGEYKGCAMDEADSVNVGPALRKKWVKPSYGVVKINSDAAIFKSGKVGFGGIMRDADGDVMVATCACIEGNFAVDEGEALAVRHSLSIALEAGLRRVQVESDSLKVIVHLKEGKRENSSFGNIIYDILEISKRCESIIFSHVCRTGNKVAHQLAQLSSSYHEVRVWIEEVPDIIRPFVMDDLISLE